MRWVVLIGLFGCYGPQPVPGAPCSADGSCPSGLVCRADRCIVPGTDADAQPGDAPDDVVSDAMVDMPAPIDVIDAAPDPMPQLVQQAGGFNSPATTLTVTFPVAPTAGNVIVAVAGCPSDALTTINGGATTWQRVAVSAVNPNIEVHVGIANGTPSVTVGLPTCTSQMALQISEWTRMSAAPFDTASDADGLLSPASAGSITTSGAPRLLLFSVATYLPNTFGVPSDGTWTALGPVLGSIEIHTWYRVATAAGTFAPGVPETRHEWDAALVALKGI